MSVSYILMLCTVLTAMLPHFAMANKPDNSTDEHSSSNNGKLTVEIPSCKSGKMNAKSSVKLECKAGGGSGNYSYTWTRDNSTVQHQTDDEYDVSFKSKGSTTVSCTAKDEDGDTNEKKSKDCKLMFSDAGSLPLTWSVYLALSVWISLRSSALNRC